MAPFWLGIALAAAAAPAAAQCVKQSPSHAVALVELYTSEGCSSCPPADRWLSRFLREGSGADQVVPLAFHVDYWDRLGWKDRFASARFTERQYQLARQARSRAVYTPGVFLNFAEFRGWNSTAFNEAVRRVNAGRAGAEIRLALETHSPSKVSIKAAFRGPRAGQAFVALYENNLATEVKAGENAGAVLRHDYVVREWIGPIDVPGKAEVQKAIQVRPDWKRDDLGVAAFVQDGAQLLQATALAACSGVRS